MFHSTKKIWWLAAFLLLLTIGCGNVNPTAVQDDSEAELLPRDGSSLLGQDNAETANAPLITVAAETVETDADGIQVGFTEDGRPYRGDPNAPVLMEEYSDYQCPFCGRFFEQTFPSINNNQIANGEVLLVFYDFPLNIHPQAEVAANAARCAGE